MLYRPFLCEVLSDMENDSWWMKMLYWASLFVVLSDMQNDNWCVDKSRWWVCGSCAVVVVGYDENVTG